jgi:adenylate cyclase
VPTRFLAAVKSSYRALAFLLIALAAVGAQHTETLATLNGKLLDGAFAFLRTSAPRPVARDVVVIGIDVDDLRAFSEPRDFWHPNYGRLLAVLGQARPAVVGLDIVFPERSYQHLIPGLDQALLKGLLAIRGQVPVVLARTVDDFNNFREIFAPYIAVAGPESVGSVVVCRDDDDVIRRFDEYLCNEKSQEAIPSLAGIMAKRLGVEQTWRGYINYRVGGGIQYLPFREVLRRAESAPAELRAAVEGRPVFVGFVLPFEDRRTVPVDLAAWEPGNRSVPGVLVHAQVLRSMLNGGLLKSIDAWMVWLLSLLAAAFVFLPGGGRATIAFVLFVVALAGAMLYLLNGGWVLQPAAPAAAGAVALATRFVSDSIAQARERATLRNAFGGYVSPQIMSEILAGRLSPDLGGKRERVCILFSDIRSFTTRSEHMSPEVLIAMLNRYFTEMTQSVHERGGTVDKFIGDGMMCFFGAPQPLANPAAAAAAAGRDMLQRLEGLNRQFQAEGQEAISIGIGLHLGEVIVGHVGSATRHEYTAIGDAVNAASRIEGLTKSLGYALVVSRDVWAELEDPQEYVQLGDAKVKGRSDMMVYGYTKSRIEVDNGEQTWIGMLGSRQ